jgi:hypothetical protein
LDSIKDLEVRSNFEIYLKNQILPTLNNQVKLLNTKEESEWNLSQDIINLSNLDEETENLVKNKRLKIIKILGMKIFNEINTQKIDDWRTIMFSDEFIFENVNSIEDCVVYICRSHYMNKLKFILKYLVEYYGISNIITLENIPRDCNQILEEIFIENLNQFMTISK